MRLALVSGTIIVALVAFACQPKWCEPGEVMSCRCPVCDLESDERCGDFVLGLQTCSETSSWSACDCFSESEGNETGMDDTGA